jgi:HSP20 family protein
MRISMEREGLNPELDHWNPFKFLRKNSNPSATTEPTDMVASRQGQQERSDFSGLFSVEPWRAMSEFLHDTPPSFGALDRWFGGYSPLRFLPGIDVVDNGESQHVRAEARHGSKGFAYVDRGRRTGASRREKQDIRCEENGCYLLERAYGAFLRTIPLPEDVDVDRVEAKIR